MLKRYWRWKEQKKTNSKDNNKVECMFLTFTWSDEYSSFPSYSCSINRSINTYNQNQFKQSSSTLTASLVLQLNEKLTIKYMWKTIHLQLHQKSNQWLFSNECKSGSSFICYLAAPWPTLGHLQGENHTLLMLITASSFRFSTQRSPEPRNKIGSQRLVKPEPSP